jgi:hypothetical protein
MNVFYAYSLIFQGNANGMKANATIDETRSSGTLRSVEWEILADVPVGQPIGPIFMGQQYLTS